jgi:S1-C subfamily serine protease
MSPVNLFDLLIILILIGSGVGGYRLGFVARMASWIGLALGIAVASWAVPKLMEVIEGPDPGSRLLIVGAAFLIVASLGGALGATAGTHIRRAIPFGPVRSVDQAGGAVAGVFGALVIVWLLLPAVATVPGDISREARNSSIARALDDFAPRAPKSLQALRQRVGEANFPEVFDDLRPSPRTGIPPQASVLSPAVRTRVAASTVLVRSTACGRRMEGSGFSPADDVIVTNAHVVAGARNVSVMRPDRRVLSAQVQVFDPRRDLAVLSVRGLDQAPLQIAEGDPGDEGAVFGHPRGQVAVEVHPARIDDERTAIGRDLYNESQTRRRVFFLAASLSPGDSGGALVNTNGAVVGVAFAIAPDEPATAYAVTDEELRPVLAQPRSGAVSTGPCVN